MGNESLHLGLDTGASVNVLDLRLARKLAGHLTLNNTLVSVVGMDKGTKKLKRGEVYNVIIENYYCPAMEVALISLAQFQPSHRLPKVADGIIGYEFLRHFKTVINFKRQKISLYHRSNQRESYIVAR